MNGEVSADQLGVSARMNRLVASERTEDLLARQREDYASALLRGFRQLRWSADRLAAERQKRLRELLSWSVERSAFYQERLSGVDIERFTEADLPSLPIVTKAEVMGSFDQLVTDPALTLDLVNDHVDNFKTDPYLLDRYRVVATSGSTGVRALFLYGWDEWCDFATVASRWTVEADGTRASLFSSGPRHLSGALTAFWDGGGFGQTPKYLLLPASLPLPEIVARLNAAQPNVLSGYASIVHLLVLEADAGRLHLVPSSVSTTGEQCSEELRALVRRTWGVEIRDYWGLTEGACAFPCSAGRAMHLPDDLVILEVVDADNKPVSPGEQGAKALLTVLYKKTQPLIRYEIGDGMTLLSEPCSCGCAHRRIANIVGRSTSFFVYSDGTAVHWLGMVSIMLSNDWVAEYQVQQTSTGADLRVVVRRPHTLGGLRADFARVLASSGLVDPQVTVSEVPSLPRLQSGKLQQFCPLPPGGMAGSESLRLSQ
jgi:phenylacetate-coenzyme A ligase PaaK-like adenylate-forming protein